MIQSALSIGDEVYMVHWVGGEFCTHFEIVKLGLELNNAGRKDAVKVRVISETYTNNSEITVPAREIQCFWHTHLKQEAKEAERRRYNRDMSERATKRKELNAAFVNTIVPGAYIDTTHKKSLHFNSPEELWAFIAEIAELKGLEASFAFPSELAEIRFEVWKRQQQVDTTKELEGAES